MNYDMNPFTQPDPTEVPLPKAPLIKVISQVRFPKIASIVNPDFIGEFQESIREIYPNLTSEKTHEVVIHDDKAELRPADTIWRFSSNTNWRVSLSPNFVALETSNYLSRSDFIEKLQFILSKVEEFVSPATTDRIGIRYIDRVTGDSYSKISELIRAELLGVSSSPVAESLEGSLAQNQFDLGNRKRLMARWGHLSANQTFDPGNILPIPEKSWVLDLDMFTTEPMDFDSERIVNEVRLFSSEIYKFFRWAIKQDFLKEYGASF